MKALAKLLTAYSMAHIPNIGTSKLSTQDDKFCAPRARLVVDESPDPGALASQISFLLGVWMEEGLANIPSGYSNASKPLKHVGEQVDWEKVPSSRYIFLLLRTFFLGRSFSSDVAPTLVLLRADAILRLISSSSMSVSPARARFAFVWLSIAKSYLLRCMLIR